MQGIPGGNPIHWASGWEEEKIEEVGYSVIELERGGLELGREDIKCQADATIPHTKIWMDQFLKNDNN